MWEEFSFLDPADPDVPLDLRLAAGDCARLVAGLDALGRLPAGWTRGAVLERARAFLPLELAAYPRELRAELELDYIELTGAEGNYAAALQLAAQARAALRDVPQALAELRVLEANHAMILGRFEEAMASIDAASNLLSALQPQQRPRPYVPIYAEAVKGLILVSLGLPDRAFASLQRCEDALARGESPESEGMVASLATQLALARDDFAWIERTLPPRLEAGGFQGDTPELTRNRWLDVEVARARAALLSGEGLEAARDSLQRRLGPGPLLNAVQMDGPLALAELEFAMGAPLMALERIERLEADLSLRLSSDARLPLQALYELKGRILLGSGAPPADLEAVHAELERSFGDLLRAWDTAPDRDGGVGFLLFDSRSSLLATLIRTTLALSPGHAGAVSALEYVLEADARSTLVRRLGAAHATVAEIQARLVPNDGGILHYVPSPFGSVIFAITPRDVRVFDAASARSLRKWNLNWCAALLDPTLGRNDARVAQPEGLLRAGLLPPELQAEILRWSSLVVVGNESLGFVPFEALSRGRDDPKPLGLSHAIGYLPGLTVGLHLTRAPVADEPALDDSAVQFVVGTGQVSDEAGRPLPALPWRADDLRLLRGAWAESLVALETRPPQARSAVVGAGERGVALLEIVAHGVHEHGREREFGLAFDAGHKLFPEDLDRAPTPPLVALAVCEVGRGVARVGDEGASHMGGAFLVSGSRAVLMSRHDLSYEASIALLAAFNRGLAEGKTVSQSLLAARQVLAAQPRWAHPRYFALLYVYGDGSQRALDGLQVAERVALPDAWLLVGGLLLFGAGAWALRRSARARAAPPAQR